jgi:DNA-binding NtrC family response regulator
MVPSSDVPGGALFTSARKCVLLVEDELLIRMIVSDELRDAGYHVIEAANGDEALVIFTSKVSVDLIISDVRMPGALDGIGLLAIVRRTSATLPVIITSGHLDPEVALADGATRFLAKPYAMELILGAVRDELAKAS